MSDPRAIEGDYADFKLIRTRKVCQIVVEVPLEEAEAVTRLLGFPNITTGTRCAVVRLNEDSGPCPTHGPEQAAGDRALDAAPAAPKSKIKTVMALARDKEFWIYLSAHAGVSVVTSEEEALTAIKFLCGVQSRTEFDEREKAASTLDRLRADFSTWQRAAR